MKINKSLCFSTIFSFSVMVPLLVGSEVALAVCTMPTGMNGGWFADDGAFYNIREFEGEVWWIGVSSDDGKSWTNMFHGKRKGKKIKGTWISSKDKGQVTVRGTLELEDKGEYYINKKSTGDFPSKQWTMPCFDTGDFGASVKYPRVKHGLPVPIYIPIEPPKIPIQPLVQPPVQPPSTNSLDSPPTVPQNLNNPINHQPVLPIFQPQTPMECQVEGITVKVGSDSSIDFSSDKGVQCFDLKERAVSMKVPVREISPDENTCSFGDISMAYHGFSVYITNKKSKRNTVSCNHFEGNIIRFKGITIYQDKDLGKLTIHRFDEDLADY